MQGKVRIFARKAFALLIATAMSMPTAALAAEDTIKIYDQNSSVMGIADNTENQKETRLAGDNSVQKETDSYKMDMRARLDSLNKIIYELKISKKNTEEKDTGEVKAAQDININFTPNPNSSIKNLKLLSAKALSPQGTKEIAFEENSSKSDLEGLKLKGAIEDEIVLEIAADIREAKDAMAYDMNLSLFCGEDLANISYNLIANKEIIKEDDKEIEKISLDLNDKESDNLKGEIETSDIFGLLSKKETISWTDYLANDDKEAKEITYEFKLDDKQDTTDTKINIDYYENTKDGFIIKKEFSQSIDFAKKIEFEIPANYIAKISLKTKVDKNNAEVKAYSLNNRQVKNPAYKEEEKTPAEDDEEDHQADSIIEEKPNESDKKDQDIKIDDANNEDQKESDTEIKVTDSNGKEIPVEVKENTNTEENANEADKISALILNKDSLLSKLESENNLDQIKKSAIEELANDLDSYNDEKITQQELLDFTKKLRENYNIDKTDLRLFIESILSGLNKQSNKAANLNIDEIIDYAYPEVTNEKSQDESEEKAFDKKEEETKEEQVEKTQEENLPAENTEEEKTDEKKDPSKTFDEDLAKLKDAANKEEEKTSVLDNLKSLVGLTDLAKADKELKAALADENKSLEEIQNLLNSFETKYNLSKADQAKLMDDNGDAIKKLIAKDSDQNFRPDMLIDISPEKTPQAVGASRPLTDEEKQNLENKQFLIMTRFDIEASQEKPVLVGQSFTIHLDEKLIVKDPSTLKPIDINGTEISEKPSYDPTANTITYTLKKQITRNQQIPLNIPVDYNTEKITLDENGEFVVTNRVTGIGVTDPKDLLPQRVDKNGNQAGSIIEPGRHDVTQIIEPDDSNYRINVDANADPVIKNGELVGYNWKVKVTSDTNLSELGYKANFTTVKGSGLGEIKDKSETLENFTDQLRDEKKKLLPGINDSKHHEVITSGIKEITYSLFTPITNKQEKYMIDISIILTKKTKDGKPKVGAKRIVIDEGWPIEKVREATPTRVGMNNRTTVLGEFVKENKVKWTITDAVSTGDEGTSLPVEKDRPGTNVGLYQIGSDGKMVSVKPNTPPGEQPVGTIAVYEYGTTRTGKEPHEFSGVTVSKYQPIRIKQTWAGIAGTKQMPGQTIEVKDANGNSLADPKTVGEGEPGQADREFEVPDVKTWEIGDDGSVSKITPNIVQVLPDDTTLPDGKTYSYKEKYNYHSLEDGAYHLYNVMTESTDEKDSSFTIIKTDSKDPTKKLAGAEFTLQSPSETIKLQTGADGQINFKNISPGTYTLIENKAPVGYKLDQQPKQITVHNDGTVSVDGNNISMQAGKVATVLARHNYYPNYPSYMNAMHYGSIDEKGNIEFYIYLKPEANGNDGSTNKNTRLNLNLAGGGNITSVEVLDVAPGDRYNTRSKMQNQTAGSYEGNEVLNKNHANKITGQDGVRDSFTGKTGYQIKFPAVRFGGQDGDWGFLVKVKAKGGTSSSTVSYDWLTDNKNVANEAKMQETIGLSTKNSTGPTGGGAADDATRITITNEEFQKSPVELTKLDESGVDGLSGATFTLMDSAGNPIIDVQSQTEGEGKTKGLASFGKQAPGNYIIEEKKAPTGYKKSNVVFDVNVAEDGKVTYKARFKDGNGTPINGVDYILEDVEVGQDLTDYGIKVINQSMKLQEKQSQPDDGRIGWTEGVWEAYGIESYRYYGSFTIDNVVKGGRFKIQFDNNLDFKRYVYEIPDLKDGEGHLLAKPYFNYDTNLLTYVFVKDATGVSAEMEIIGIIPDKYHATQTNKSTGYDFKVIVDPDNPKVKNMTSASSVTNKQTTVSNNNILDFNVKTDYYTYDSQGGSGPLTSEYITDIYKGDDGEIYMKAVSYYNPTNLSSGPRTVRLDWLSMKKPRPGLEYYRADGYPAFGFDDLKVYKVYGNQDRKQYLMPLSYGIRPEKDTSDYIRVYSKSNVDPQRGFSESGGDVRVTYNPDYLKSTEGLLDYGHNRHPLEIDLPRVSGNEGYVIVQTFKVTDEQRFKDLWSGYYLSNGSRHTGSYQKGNYNWAKGSESEQEIPKFYSQRIKLPNRKYQPGSFKIKKTNEADNKNLQGAVFELKDQEGKTINRYSGSDGLVEFNDLEPGVYTLQEAQAPNGFIKSNRRWQVIVYDTGNVIINEVGGIGTSFTGKDTIVIPVSNKPSGGDFKVYKKGSGGKVLPGAKFKITKQGETNSTEVTSNENGVVEFKNLTQGTYIIEELEAPAGYKKLDKKWVLVIDAEGKKKVYNYREKSSQTTGSILEQVGVNWVNVAGRSLDGWSLYDNRRADWTGNYPTPFKLGTRIVGINTEEKYVIQRYVLNPEAKSIGATTGTIHREKVEYTNMDWYNGGAKAGKDYQVYKLDKAVTGSIADIRLADYGAENITSFVEGSAKKVAGRYGEPDRLSLEFPETDKPIVVDIKVPYKEDTGGVGTGMDWVQNGTTYWKSDYYERVNIIKQSDLVVQESEGGIQGSYIGENSLDVRNEQKSFGFKLEKVKEGDLATVIPGAEFKLTGPDPGDGSAQNERFMTTGPDGMVSFTKLSPGTYKLEEKNPAPGYEKANTTWTVRIDSDGKVFIKTNTKDQANALANASLSVVDTEEPLNKSPRLYSTYTNPLVRDLVSPLVTKSVDTNSISTTESIERINADILTDELMTKATGTDGNLASIRGLLVETTKRPAIVKMAQDVQGESMGLEIGDQIVPGVQRAASDWEKIDPNRSKKTDLKPTKSTNDEVVLETRMTDINKVDKKFKQVFLFGQSTFGARPRKIQIHSQPEKFDVREKDPKKAIVKVYTVTGSSLDNLGTKTEITNVKFTQEFVNGYWRLKNDSVSTGVRGNILVEVETYYDSNKGVGLGADYISNTKQSRDSTNWIGESYAGESDINYKHLITINQSTGGSVTAPEYGETGNTINLNIVPDPGYEWTGNTITDKDGNEIAKDVFSFTMPDKDVIVTNTFEKLNTDVTIYFNPGNGGSGTMPSQTVPQGSYKLPSPTFTANTGKEFKAWSVGGKEYQPGDTIQVSANTTLTAVWKYKEVIQQDYAINIDPNIKNGKVTSNKAKAKENEVVTFTVTPARGYELESLSINNTDQTADGKKGTFTMGMPNYDVNVTATFRPIQQGYNINIDPNIKNGKVTSDKNKAVANDYYTLTIKPDPGYVLDKLYLNGTDFTHNVYNNKVSPMMGKYDANVYATFKRDPYKSIISFDPNGGSGVMESDEVYNGYQYTIPNCEFTPPAGKEFLRWTINGYPYTPGSVVTIYQSYTLKAEWKDAPVNLNSIRVNSLNHKTTYKVGEELDVENLTIEATMSNGSKQTIPVNPGMVSGFSSANEAKDMPLTITYGGKTTTYNINVVKPEPDAFDINIISSNNGKVEANKLTAKEGEEVTLTATTNEGYEFNSFKVTDAEGNEIKVTDGKFTMPKSAVNVSANYIRIGGTTPSEGEVEIPADGFARITNNQTGIELNIFKKNTSDIGLLGAEFELKKDDGTDTIIATATSDEQGNVKFVDKDGNPIKLQVGKYLLTETKSPAGYKKPAAPWKLEVVEEGGQLVIKESGPKHTSTSYLSSDGAKAGDNTSTTDAIKYKSIIKNIDPVNKTFVQRIYIDTRGYTGSNKINVQITPTTKREEVDTPSQPPFTTSGGVKTAYRTTYKVTNPGTDPDFDDILNSYDLRKSNVSVVNTARWRPFDWGFDEDQINLENNGVYFIDIEGFYDDNIVDLKEIELKVDFYAGEWVFAQRTYENGQLGWKYDKDIGDTGGLQTKRDAAYQQGMEALYAYYSKLYGEAAAKTWFYGNSDNKKYDVWLRKGATISGKYYDAGRIVLRSDLENSNIKDATPIQTSYTKADIKDLYSSDRIKTIPQDGMTITNEDETYNITFSKHAKLKTDGSEEDYNANRLEGAVFKLQKREGSFWYDVDESYVASAFNGYFGFRRLEPGRYRLLEVTPPIGYKPIEGELLQFTIKQIDTRSGKIINPKTKKEVALTELTIIDSYNEEKIELKNAKAKIKGDPENKVYNFSELVNTDKFNMDTCMILSEVKDKDGNPKEIPLKTANFIDPESNEPMGRIIAGAQGYITLEYKEGGYVAEYGKAGSSGGSLVDYVTAATAKNMGKILNEKPGKGKVTIKKFDENGKALGSVKQGELTVGAKFQAIRVSGKRDADGNPVKDAVYEGVVNKDGILVIDGLPVGDYELKEVANPSGHINTGQIWHFTVGGKELDPYAGDIARTGQNLSDQITLSKSKLKVVRPNAEDEKATGREGNSVIRPHVGQTLEFDNEFKLDSNIEIRPGDYFVLKLSDNIDLEGVKTDGVGNLDLFADGVGTVAKAEYDKEAGTITYTFTKYAEQYKLLSIENRLGAHINLKNVRNSDPNAQVGLSVGDSTINHDINIKYIVDTISEYDDNATVNLASKITEYNTKTGEFVHYFYVNRDRYYNAKNQYFQYKPSLDVEDLQLTYYKLRNNNDYYIAQSMPESFAVNESDSNLLRSGGTSPEFVKANETKTYNLGKIGTSGYDSMIIKVTGRMKTKEGQKILSYKGISALYSTYQYHAYDNYRNYLGIRTAMSPYVDRWDAIYEFENISDASAKLSISAVNPTNRIKFKKVDPQGQVIKPELNEDGTAKTDKDGKVINATKFSLFKNGGTAEKPNETWTPKGNAKTVDKDGIVLYEKLEEGYYKVVESTAPAGYIKPTEAVAYFKVDSSGKIYHKVTVKKPDSDVTEEIFQQVDGTIPINIVNNKAIEFEKVDATDNTKKLKDAEFDVYYKETSEGSYAPLTVKKTVNGKEQDVTVTAKSDKDGKFILEVTKDGYYALKETKAPDGYTMFPGYIKEFKLEKGRVLVLEKDPLKASLTKGEKGMLTSQILEVDKDKGTFKQRLVINPNHNKWTFDEYDSHLRLYVDSWNVVDTNTSKLIKVAVLDKTKNISDLTEKDFKSISPTNYYITATTNPLKYSIKEMYGSTNYTRDQEGRSNLSTDKTLVVEFTGKLKENATSPVNPKSDVYINAFGTMVDEVTNKLDITKVSESKGSYIDTTIPIPVENRKAEYPLTGGPKVWIGFTILGLAFMTLAGFYYNKKKTIG